MSHPFHDQDVSAIANDADDENEDHPRPRRYHDPKMNQIPMLLFVPTNELVTNTFRLASIARDIGMEFHPSPSLSHLFFSWPSTPSPTSSSTSPSTSSSSLSSSSLSSVVPSNAVPLPFPLLSTPAVSLSVLRVFVSFSRGFFRLVFYHTESEFEPLQDPNSADMSLFGRASGPKILYMDDLCRSKGPEFEPMQGCNSPNLSLVGQVSGCKVMSMDDLCREMMGHGWSLFRTHNPHPNSVYLFMKKDVNRVRVRVQVRAEGGGGGCGECRIRELRLPALDFGSEIPYRVLLYILLMTDDIFYIA